MNSVENMNPRNKEGETPLCLAAKNNHDKIFFFIYHKVLKIQRQVKKRKNDMSSFGNGKKFKFDEN